MQPQTAAARAIVDFLAQRLAQLGRPTAVSADLAVFESGVLDSVALVELVGVVEQAAGREVDMLMFDPTVVVTATDLMEQLEAALVN
jgi:acyl carrier protein